jgi:hypothetical protein
MSECCLPNLGCLAIPIKYIEVAGQAGQNGTDGRGISSESYNDVSGELTLLFTSGDPSFTTGDLRGTKGDQGDQGVNGVSRLYSRLMDFYESTLINQWVQQHDYTVPANTLLNIGDSLVIKLRSMKLFELGGIFDCQRRIMWNNTSCTLVSTTEPYMISAEGTQLQYDTTVEIIKSDVNEAICRVVADIDLYTDNIFNTDKLTYQVNLTGLNFGIDNVISSGLRQVGANQIYFKSITIDKITAV